MTATRTTRTADTPADTPGDTPGDTTTPAVRAAARAPVSLVAGALVVIYVVWGSTYLALRVMVEEMPPLLGSGLRALAASALLAAALAALGRGSRLRVSRSELAACAVIGMLLPALGQGLVTLAEDGGAPSGLTALIVASVPLWVVVYRLASGDRPSATTLAGVLVGFAGAAFLVGGGGAAAGVPTWALLAVVVASMTWAFGSWLLPRLRVPRDPFVLVVYEMLVGGGVLCVAGLAYGERFHLTAYSGRAWTAWGYLVVVGSILGFATYAWLLQSTSLSVASTYAYVSPVIALFLGWLLLGEPVTGATVLAALVVVGGVVLVVGRGEPLAPDRAPEPSDEPTDPRR